MQVSLVQIIVAAFAFALAIVILNALVGVLGLVIPIIVAGVIIMLFLDRAWGGTALNQLIARLVRFLEQQR